jgi:hypothetical protein
MALDGVEHAVEAVGGRRREVGEHALVEIGERRVDARGGASAAGGELDRERPPVGGIDAPAHEAPALEPIEDAGERRRPLARRGGQLADRARLTGTQLRERVDLGLAQAEVGELGREVVEDAVHGGLEGGDHGTTICHESE